MLPQPRLVSLICSFCVMALCLFLQVGIKAMNNDGNVDIVWRNYSTTANEVWAMSGTAYSTTLPLATASDTNWTMIGTADMDGDSQLDIVWYHPPSGHIAYWYMNGTNLITSLD